MTSQTENAGAKLRGRDVQRMYYCWNVRFTLELKRMIEKLRGSEIRRTAWAFEGCLSKIPQTGWFKQQEIIFFTVLKAWSCQDWLDKQGFWKLNAAREWETRHKNSEKSEDQGTNTAPRWRCRNWIQASFIILSAMNERICGELSYNSCGLQGQRTKWSLMTN